MRARASAGRAGGGVRAVVTELNRAIVRARTGTHATPPHTHTRARTHLTQVARDFIMGIITVGGVRQLLDALIGCKRSELVPEPRPTKPKVDDADERSREQQAAHAFCQLVTT